MPVELYTLLKAVHIGTVVVSGTGFVLRAQAALRDAAWVQSRAARTLPHVVDTLLLSTAVAMAVIGRISPLAAPWLAAKICGLLVYIGLGMLALKPGRPLALRVAAALAAGAVFAYIVAVALTKSAWPAAA